MEKVRNLKKTLLIILLIILIIVILKLFVNNRPNLEPDGFRNEEYQTETSYKNWKTYSDSKGGYKLKYPTNWMLEDGGDNEMIRADIAKDTSVGLQIRMLENKNLDFDDFAEQYLLKFENEMTTHWNGSIRQVSSRSSFISDVYFNRTAFEFSRTDSERWYLIEYIWQKDEKIITFQCGIMYKKLIKFEPILDSIADSFEFTD